MKFVPFGMSAEIVVVIENQDALIRAECGPIEVGGGQTGDAAADDDQIDLFLKMLAGNGKLGVLPLCIRANSSTATG